VLGNDKVLVFSFPLAPANVQLLLVLEALKGMKDNPLLAAAMANQQLVQGRLTVNVSEGRGDCAGWRVGDSAGMRDKTPDPMCRRCSTVHVDGCWAGPYWSACCLYPSRTGP
jgi:hypothetical protein